MGYMNEQSWELLIDAVKKLSDARRKIADAGFACDDSESKAALVKIANDLTDVTRDALVLCARLEMGD